MEQATFTDPEDQSAWLYHRWLLSQALALQAAPSRPPSQTGPPEVGQQASVILLVWWPMCMQCQPCLSSSCGGTAGERERSGCVETACLNAPQELQRILRREVERCKSLLDSEPDRGKCKWPILTLARLHKLLHSLGAGAGRQAAWGMLRFCSECFCVDLSTMLFCGGCRGKPCTRTGAGGPVHGADADRPHAEGLLQGRAGRQGRSGDAATSVTLLGLPA